MLIRSIQVLVIFLFISCQEEGELLNKQVPIIDHNWGIEDSISFQFSITDTISYYNVYFNLRTTDSYKYSNIYIFTDLKFPNNKIRRDTFEFYLADKYGKWFGNNSGSTIQNSFQLYNKKVNFPLTGDYVLTFHQALRELNLTQIMDVGLIIKLDEKDAKDN